MSRGSRLIESPTSTLDPVAGVALFTDGSASYRDRSGGFGWVALDAFEGMEMGSESRADTTISQMELAAPMHGLFYLHDKYGPCEVIVYSDSKYVVLGATYRSRKRTKNAKYWRRLDEAIAAHEYVEFTHIKGHSGQTFNEMADALAGTARRKGLQ